MRITGKKWLLTAALLMLATPALAEDKPVMNSYDDDIRSMAAALNDELDKDQAQALAYILNGFGMIRAVKVVRGDVGTAVEQCGKANPDLKKDMRDRFAGWKQTVDPAVKTNEKALDQAVKGGTFDKPEKIKAYLDLVDKAAAEADSKIEKTPVTSSEACHGLLKSMDRTEETLAKLLNDIDWPVAVEPKDESGKTP